MRVKIFFISFLLVVGSSGSGRSEMRWATMQGALHIGGQVSAFSNGGELYEVDGRTTTYSFTPFFNIFFIDYLYLTGSWGFSKNQDGANIHRRSLASGGIGINYGRPPFKALPYIEAKVGYYETRKEDRGVLYDKVTGPAFSLGAGINFPLKPYVGIIVSGEYTFGRWDVHAVNMPVVKKKGNFLELRIGVVGMVF